MTKRSQTQAGGKGAGDSYGNDDLRTGGNVEPPEQTARPSLLANEGEDVHSGERLAEDLPAEPSVAPRHTNEVRRGVDLLVHVPLCQPSVRQVAVPIR